MSLFPELGGFCPSDARDRDNARRLAGLLAASADPYGRDPCADHVTGSGFVVSPCRTRTLLVHHAKLNRWLQPGGHCDGDRDVARVAAREVAEETGLVPRLVSPAIFDIDIHAIPAIGGAPGHLHYDLRYLFEAGPDAPLVVSAESRALRWVRLARLETLTDAPSVLVLRDRLAGV